MVLIVQVSGALFQGVQDRDHWTGTSAKAENIFRIDGIKVVDDFLFRHCLDIAVAVYAIDVFIPNHTKPSGEVVG